MHDERIVDATANLLKNLSEEIARLRKLTEGLRSEVRKNTNCSEYQIDIDDLPVHVEFRQ